MKDRINRINIFMKDHDGVPVMYQYKGRYIILTGFEEATNKKLITIMIETLSDFSDTLFDGFSYMFHYNYQTDGDFIKILYGKELREYKEKGFGAVDAPVIKMLTHHPLGEAYYISAVNVDMIIEPD